MYRMEIEKPYKWKESKRRKPLIIEGARQVGKTYREKFNPEISIHTSTADYREESWLIDHPLYAVEGIYKCV